MVYRGRDRDGEIGNWQTGEGGCEETFRCLRQTCETCMFTVPPAVALLNYMRSGILWRIFFQTGIFAGFSLYIISEAAMRGAGDIIFHSLGCRGIIVYLEYQSVCPIVGIGSPHPLLRNRECLPPWIQSKGGSNTLLQVRGWGDSIRTTGIEAVAICLLSDLGGRVERNKPFTRAARVRWIIFIFGDWIQCSEAAMGGGARSAPFSAAWAQKDGCAQRTGAHARPKTTSIQ